MSKSLAAWFFLIITTLVLLGCGADNQVASQLENEPCKGTDANSGACLPPPDPCDLSPLSAACLPDLLSITSPARNSLWLTPPTTLTVAFLEHSAPANLQLTLNGHNVKQYARIDANYAVIKGSAIESLLVNGDNTFQAQSGGEIEKLVFVYAIQKPRIIVTAATDVVNGSTSPQAGDVIKVSGVVRDAAPVSNLTINGASATLSNGHDFTAEVPYADIYQLVATDAIGQTGNIAFAAPQHRLNPALALKVNNSIFNLIKPLINEALANFDSSTLINSNQRVPLGKTATSPELAVTRIDIDKNGEPSIDMHFVPADLKSSERPMLLDVDVTLPQVKLGTSIYPAHGVNRLFGVNINLYDAKVTLRLMLTVDNTNHVKLAPASTTPFKLRFSWLFPELDIDDDCRRNPFCAVGLGIINFVLEKLSDNATVQAALLDFLNNTLSPNIATALAKLDLPNIPTQIQLDTDNDGNTDTQMTIDLAPSLLATDAAGNSDMQFAGSLFVAPQFLPTTYHGALGSVYVETGVVPAFNQTADNGSEFDLGIALPSNTLNQALLSLYQGGVLDHITMAMKPADLGSMGSLLSAVDVDAKADMRMRLVAGAVPYITLDHVTTAGKTAGLTFHMDNATLYMDVKKTGEAEFSVMLVMVADIAANLQLGIDGSNFIQLDTDNLVAMDVVSVLPQGLAAPGAALAGTLTPALIESQLGDAVKALLKADTLSETLQKTMQISVSMAQSSNFLLQLPYDIGIILRDVRVDSSDAYLMMQIDLLNNTEVHNAVEPLTARIIIDKR